MITKLTHYGRDLALVFDQELLDQLQIDEVTPLKIETDGRTIVVTPMPKEDRKQRFERLLEETNDQYGEVFKRLAES